MICDQDDASRASAGRTHPHVPLIADGEDLLDDAAIDAVIIALPISAHHHFALEALTAGKHVLVEKPLATSVVELGLDVVRIIEAAEQSLGYNAAPVSMVLDGDRRQGGDRRRSQGGMPSLTWPLTTAPP